MQQIKYPSQLPARDMFNENVHSGDAFASELISQFSFYRNVKMIEQVTDHISLNAFKKVVGKCAFFSGKLNAIQRIKVRNFTNANDYILNQVRQLDLFQE
ncbi:Conserved_hypothetical protein [Hexamita inflata]|uniref:Uncharacterized protein n=1 Tax=Hexamita inflata TaxID=28002 RepID=A0AA86Q8X7_9EUKA|nr:Conserved hypothetical protein [Hexamita inflata]